MTTQMADRFLLSIYLLATYQPFALPLYVDSEQEAASSVRFPSLDESQSELLLKDAHVGTISARCTFFKLKFSFFQIVA